MIPFWLSSGGGVQLRVSEPEDLEMTPRLIGGAVGTTHSSRALIIANEE